LAFLAAQLTTRLQAIHNGHEHIQDDKIERLQRCDLEQLAPVRGLKYAVARTLKTMAQGRTRALVIVHDDNKAIADSGLPDHCFLAPGVCPRKATFNTFNRPTAGQRVGENGSQSEFCDSGVGKAETIGYRKPSQIVVQRVP
jgi:hypothetical protein